MTGQRFNKFMNFQRTDGKGALLLSVFMLCALTVLALHVVADEQPAADASPIHNYQRINKTLASGAMPVEERDFAWLKSQGFKTVICVDGSTPQLELLAKYELRSVHVPLPYSGIPEEATKTLTKAVRECDGPIFVHCHHGLHRGPAAAAICGIVQGHFENAQAVKYLKEVGTNPNYVGLYRDVERFHPIPEQDKSAFADVTLLKIAPIDELTDVMLRIEKHFKALKKQIEKGELSGTNSREQSHKQWRSQFVAISEEFKEAGRLHRQDDELKSSLLEAAKSTQPVATIENFSQMAQAFARLEKRCIECHADSRQ